MQLENTLIKRNQIITKLHLPPDGILRAITIREPYASLVAMGIKVIENKPLPFPANLPLPMTVAIHASSDESQIAEDCEEISEDPFINDAFSNPRCKPCVPGSDYFYVQTIVGLVDIVGSVNIHGMSDREIEAALEPFGQCDQVKPGNTYYEWANGPHCLIFRNARRFRTGIMCRGQLNYWRVTPSVQALIVEHARDLLTNLQDMPTIPVGGVAKCHGKPPISV